MMTNNYGLPSPLTAQSIFGKVALHLIRQGRAAFDGDKQNEQAAAPGPQKRKTSYRGKAEWSLRRTKDVRAFKNWLRAGGADLLRPTNQYELVRFRCSGGLSIVYVNDRGVPTTKTGVAEEAWAAFVAGEQFPYPPSEAGPILTAAEFFITDAVLDGLAARKAPITAAEMMTAHRCTMAAALGALRAGEAAGVLVRSGGEPGTALRWAAATIERRDTSCDPATGRAFGERVSAGEGV